MDASPGVFLPYMLPRPLSLGLQLAMIKFGVHEMDIREATGISQPRPVEERTSSVDPFVSRERP